MEYDFFWHCVLQIGVYILCMSLSLYNVLFVLRDPVIADLSGAQNLNKDRFHNTSRSLAYAREYVYTTNINMYIYVCITWMLMGWNGNITTTCCCVHATQETAKIMKCMYSNDASLLTACSSSAIVRNRHTPNAFRILQ